MINGFEQETAPLNIAERKVAEHLALNLQLYYIGKENSVTSDRIIKYYNSQEAIKGFAKMNGARLRKIINHIRLKGMVLNLIATSKGYYVSRNAAEIAKYKDSLIQRAEAILQI